MTAHSTRRQITLLELATYRLGRDARTRADFDEAGVPILGGCETCGATVADYNRAALTLGSHPLRRVHRRARLDRRRARRARHLRPGSSA